MINDGNQIFTIVVQCLPDQATAISACRFGQAVCHSAHKINGVFFYGDGVYHLSTSTADIQLPLNNSNQSQHPAESWIKLSQQYDFVLQVCVAAAERRGIAKISRNSAYQLVGLGQLIELSSLADQVIQFTN